MANDPSTREYLPPESRNSPSRTRVWQQGVATEFVATVPEKVAFAQPTGHQDDVRELLQRRLRWLCIVLVLTGLAITPILPQLWRPLFDDPLKFATNEPLLSRSFVLCLIVGVVANTLLWSRRHLSLRFLRLAEYVVIAIIIGFLGIDLHTALSDVFRTPAFAQTRWMRQLVITARGPLLALSLVIYGLFIPNTWRRCVVVVGGQALAPFLVVLGFTLSPDFKPEWTREVLGTLPWLALFLSLGVVLAIYATHKLATLRKVEHDARQLGQYRLLRLLGTGGMGEVYLAEHRLLKRPCAIKLIRPEKIGRAGMVQRFEREVQAITSLTHWNVVEIYDFGSTDDGTFYYVMEYLPGLTLDAIVAKHGPMPPGRVVHILRQVCSALHEAHTKGLIHRDLKPGNVILGERGSVEDVVKLLDFGLVQGPALGDSDDKLTQFGAIVGTPAYMSPEQARGSDLLTPASDLYSLGAMGYFLLTGQPPFQRPSVVQTISAHLTDPVVPPSRLRADIPADLETILLTCLEKEAERRWPDAGRLERELAGCASAGTWSNAEASLWWSERKTVEVESNDHSQRN